MKFFLVSLIVYTTLFVVMFRVGFDFGVQFLIDSFNLRGPLGLDVFSVGFFGLLTGLVAGMTSLLSALIILHKLSKKFFPGVALLKTTGLAFLTFLLLIISYLLFWPQ